LYIDTNIFKLPDSAFAAFLRGSCALQIALIIIIIIIHMHGKCILFRIILTIFFLQNFSLNSIAYIYLLVKFLFCLFFSCLFATSYGK